MLRVDLVNVYTDASNVADYTAIVKINHEVIWFGGVEQHYRPHGAAELLRKLAAQMEKNPQGLIPRASLSAGGEKAWTPNTKNDPPKIA